ncbi:FAD-dependent oxidoreductase [Reticulibacter mediterranei]|uniref:FAD-dependent oxidoreductase n=1 Tax=Reticulibacter mediterranei TaxID=2778369 RepID=A0A8J3MXY9_9CHLR|nr:NAD(P)/FAD-dependent oxidoreductase [Reticulibacter mediterranei]GHO90337.1 FAD-dependent oxidoreductase [Reticulibacter mediterranei]
MYDVIIVGARCAGAPTAMLLARKGYRVLLVDKATFPSDTMSSHFLQTPGGACLKRWGLLERITATGCPAIRNKTLDVGHAVFTDAVLPEDGVAACYAPRRILLDHILVNAAVEAGAHLWEGFHVRELLWEEGRVTGIRGFHGRGKAISEKAALVIGADGKRSMVARVVQAPTYSALPSLTCGYYTYWSGVCLQGQEIAQRDHRAVIAFPTNDEKIVVAVQWPREQFDAVRHDISGHFLETLERCTPYLAARLRAGVQAERFVGTGDLPNFFRRSSGPGWALVGDAGHCKDPILAHGMSDAFRDADLLADAVESGLSGECSLQKALADYEQRRDDAALPLYELNCQMARLEAPSLFVNRHMVPNTQKQRDKKGVTTCNNGVTLKP